MKPGPGDTDFEQWQSAMKMVARLPDGVPHEFRNTVRIYIYKLFLSTPIVIIQSRSPPATTTPKHVTPTRLLVPIKIYYRVSRMMYYEINIK